MSNLEFKEQLEDYAHWREKVIQGIEMYQEWRHRYRFSDPQSLDTILNILRGLSEDRITLAFVAEFSRGKTELINALFFAESGVRLLPSSPGRTTMCPTELFYDNDAKKNYIRLLNIESRLEELSLNELKDNPERWTEIELDCNSPAQMQKAFKELISTKKVSVEQADKLGLYDEKLVHEHDVSADGLVDIPSWRHALISFPHPLLQSGLAILDTPGLNALGAEPELTLNMLPNAQAVIFVLSADTGVTKSDMDMWKNHVRSSRGSRKQGLAVVMNKIDSMWDDLLGEEGYEESIQSQISISANILSINEKFIFPISAKQGLLAKIKSDDELLEKSRLNTLENYLSKDIINQRRYILMETILRDIGFLISETNTLTEDKLRNAENQFAEFKKLDFDNQEITSKLMAETRDQQNAYTVNVENFQSSRRLFMIQAKILVETLGRDKVNDLIKKTKKDVSSSLTTYGMKVAIRRLFDDLRDLLQDSVDATNETRRLVKAIHKKFRDEYGFKEIEPKLFSIKQYEYELEKIIEEGELFRTSTRTTMTEQSVVVNKLYSTIIAQARVTLKHAHDDAQAWSRSVLTPLMNQIKDHKIQIEGRLKMLREISESKGDISKNITSQEQGIEDLKKQRNELQTIIRIMQFDKFIEDSNFQGTTIDQRKPESAVEASK